MKTINISDETYDKIKDQLMSEEKIDLNNLSHCR
jgi:predicted CopG family antitoxin